MYKRTWDSLEPRVGPRILQTDKRQFMPETTVFSKQDQEFLASVGWSAKTIATGKGR